MFEQLSLSDFEGSEQGCSSLVGTVIFWHLVEVIQCEFRLAAFPHEREKPKENATRKEARASLSNYLALEVNNTSTRRYN